MDSEADIFGEGFWKDFLPASDEVRHKMLQDMLDGKKNKELSDAVYELIISLLRAYGYCSSDAKLVGDLLNKTFCKKEKSPRVDGIKVFFPNLCFRDNNGLRHGVKIITQEDSGSATLKFTFFALEGRLKLDGTMFMITDGEPFSKERDSLLNHVEVINRYVHPERKPSVIWCNVSEFCDKLHSFLQAELESSLKEDM